MNQLRKLADLRKKNKMKHTITTTVIQTPLGAALSADGVAMLVCKAIAVGGTFALDTAYLLSQPSDLTTLGITELYDATNGLAVWQQVNEFYAEAGTGAKLWIVGVAQATSFATYVAGTTFKGLVRGTMQTDQTLRAKMVGLCYDLPTATQTATDFKQDVLDTIAALYTCQQSMFQEHFEWFGIIDGTQMNASSSAWLTIASLTLQGKPTVGVCISGYNPWGISSVGALLGRAAVLTVGTSIGEVQNDANADYPVSSTSGYLTNGFVTKIIAGGTALTVGNTYLVAGGNITYNGVVYGVGNSFVAVTGFTSFTTTASGYLIYQNTAPKDVNKMIDNPDFQTLGTDNYLFLRTWFGKSGLWWNDGSMAADPSNPLSTIENNRVINKLDADLVAYLINLMNKKCPLDVKTGALDGGFLTSLETDFYNTYIQPLLPNEGSGDISGATIVFAGPNFNSTKTITYTLTYVSETPLGSATGTIQNSVSL